MALIPRNEPQPASYANDKKAVWREIEALWRQLRNRTATAAVGDEIVFSFAGAPVAAAKSPPWACRVAVTVVEIVFSLGTAGTTDSVVTVYVNGTSYATVTAVTGSYSASVYPSTALNEGDVVTVAATTLGTGARDYTVQVRW